MTIVSNTSPLCYLALIGHAEVLPKLYANIHITQKFWRNFAIRTRRQQFAVGQRLRPTG